jgi:hypothetical protein
MVAGQFSNRADSFRNNSFSGGASGWDRTVNWAREKSDNRVSKVCDAEWLRNVISDADEELRI